MKQLFAAVVVAGAAVVAAVALSAQAAPQAPPQQGAARGGPQTPPPPENLQILPKDVGREELLTTMRGYAQALGVQCNYCHVAEGRGGRNDMAADEKQPKKTARVMMRMTARVNETLAGEVGKPAADLTKVECATCHRGSAIPKVEMPPPAAPAQRPQAF
jgi:hypothetical protein